MRATERYYAYSTPTDLQKCVLNVTLPGAKAVSKGEEVRYVKRCEREIALKGRGVLQFDNAVISYEVVRGADNAVMIELFSDYWIVNKTTEALMCCENLPFNYHYFFVDPHPITFSASTQPSQPLVPLFYSSLARRGAAEGSKHEFLLRTQGYKWSDSFSVDTVDLDGSIQVRLLLLRHA